MPWVKLDDRFPSHRKVALLSDRAFRLYISGLCWSSENLTEGRILDRELPVIARVRGSQTAARELTEAGLWDPIDGGWIIHDYLEYNPDRAKVKAERAANAARQAAFRERKKAQRETEQNDESNAPRNSVTDDALAAPESTTATRTRHDGDTNAQKDDPANHALDQVSGIRNAVSNGTPSRPVLTTSSNEEVGERPRPSVADTPLPRVDVERACQTLADRIEANGSMRPRITQRWRDSARLMLDRDGRTLDQLLTAIDWCQTDEFWRANILSMPKLREKYEQLRLQAQRQQQDKLRPAAGGYEPYRNPEDQSAYDEWI